MLHDDDTRQVIATVAGQVQSDVESMRPCVHATIKKHRCWNRNSRIPVLVAAFALCKVNLAFAGQSARLIYARAADAADCADESTLRQSVARRLGYDPFVAIAENTVVAEVRGDGDGLRARIFVIERGNAVGGARELASKTRDCGELMLAVALAISISIDPDSLERIEEESSVDTAPDQQDLGPSEDKREASPNVSHSDPARSVAAKPPAKPPIRPTPARPPLAWHVGVQGAVATGPTPTPAIGFAASLELGAGHWAIGVEPRWILPAKTAPQADTGARASTSQIGATLTPCYRLNPWRGCYLVEVGRLASRGEVEHPNSSVALWFAQGARIAYQIESAQGYGISVGLDGLMAFNRVKMLLNDRTAYLTPWLMGRFVLGLYYVF